jgi:hypothetical protein
MSSQKGLLAHIRRYIYDSKDHVLIRITGSDVTYGIAGKTFETIVALPDSARFSYIGFTGENCCISDMTIERSKERIREDFIPRIADEISYINAPEGDQVALTNILISPAAES